MPERAVLFVDGNNWYHALKAVGVPDRGSLDLARISRKLIGTRQWVATRYYIGRVSQRSAPALYADQRSYVAGLLAADPRVSVHFGRLERRPVVDRTAMELKRYLHALPARIDPQVYRDLYRIAMSGTRAATYVEKAVDVQLAVDLVVMAERDEFDAAYLLSADGDFTPAVAAVRAHAKRIYAASPATGAALAAAVDTYIPLRKEWFGDCYRS